MPYAKHLLVKTPPDQSTLWKYLDLAKFLSLITSSSLHFTRLDTFEDPYEGAYSNPLILQNMIEKESDPDRKKKYQFKQLAERSGARHKKHFFVSCWHSNRLESAAMWKLYALNEYGLAIRSTVKRLKECLVDSEVDIQIGKVKYKDYNIESIPSGNVFYPVTHKRLSFEYEQEVRALIWFNGQDNLPKEPYYSININVKSLIDYIYVSPTAPDWIVPLVKDICLKYGFKIPIVKSDLMKLTY
ncbi:MAG: hypothetical protein WKF66_02145 [Pedobacter sp.]